MAVKHAAGFAWWCAATILLSAFLLFQVQPIISKMILPWFGGGPTVWTTCMLFFQVLLLGGYAYAHFVEQIRRPAWRAVLHVGLLVLAAVTLPITPDAVWKPLDGTRPTWRILSLLAVNVGLPYFVLASTGPLVQAWFSRVLPLRSPYRLYALSNAGSLGALLTYPFLFETTMTTGTQGTLWSALFALFALLCAGLALATWRAVSAGDETVGVPLASPAAEVPAGGPVAELSTAARTSDPKRPTGAPAASQDSPAAAASTTSPENKSPEPPSLDRRLAWLLLPALASVMLLAVTNHVCQDVAVVPFLWVVPLSLYLLSFIICFDADIWYRRRIFSLAAGFSILLIAVTELDSQVEDAIEWIGADPWLERIGIEPDVSHYMGDIVIEASVYLAMLFLVCMVCHGELVRCRPPARWLTSFYLMVAAGGALGGIVVALICPQLFSTHLELGIGLVIAFLLALGVLWDDLWQHWPLTRWWGKSLAIAAGFLLLLIVVRAQFATLNTEAVVSIRNFYGVLSIEEVYTDDPYNHLRRLLNGRILHGAQFQSPDRRTEATTYYNAESGVGTALTYHPSTEPLRVAAVGLGTGTVATYGRPGDYYCFYEINPNVVRLAGEQFEFLDNSEANIHIELGDARISMERQPPQNYDVIVLDAFSGDAIPAHLLTKEAFDEYFRHLKDDGIIAVHISNRHLDLTPVVGGISEHFAIPGIKIEWNDDVYVGEAGSDWVLLTRNEAFLEGDVVVERSEDLSGLYDPIPLWTDQYSNLFQILN